MSCQGEASHQTFSPVCLQAATAVAVVVVGSQQFVALSCLLMFVYLSFVLVVGCWSCFFPVCGSGLFVMLWPRANLYGGKRKNI